jgi:hypothetical protein
MKTSLRPLALAVAATGLAGLFLLGPAATPAHAQRIINPVNFNNGIPVNRNYYITPYLTLNQYAYNLKVLGRAYSYVPPYALGYNPYPQVINYGPIYPTYTPYIPYTYNPYLYNPGAFTGSYNPYYNPYYPY